MSFFKNTQNVTSVLFASIALFFMFLFFEKLNETSDDSKKITIVKTKKIYVRSKDHFSENNLKAFLKASNVKFPHIVFAQAMLESGNFTSNLFIKHRNMFGMRIASSRPVSYKYVTGSGYAGYETWKESVLDYIFYQCCFMKNINTEEEYYNILNKNYCQENTYDKKIKELAKEYFRK